MLLLKILTKETELELMHILAGWFMLIFHKICISLIVLKLQADFKLICSPTQFLFCNFKVSDFFCILSQNTNIKPSQVIPVKVILVLLRWQSLKKKNLCKKNTFNTHHKPQILKLLTVTWYTAIFWMSSMTYKKYFTSFCQLQRPKQQQMPPVPLLLNRARSPLPSLHS